MYEQSMVETRTVDDIFLPPLSLPPPDVLRQNREYIRNGGDPDEFGACDTLFCETQDAMGVEAGREYITLSVVRKMR